MFDIGWTELLLIAVVAIVVIGPKDLPRAMRSVGQWTTRVKRMAGDFQRQFNEAVREAELDDVKNEVAKLKKLDPMADLKKTIAKADTDLKGEIKKVDDSVAASLAKPDTVNPVPKTEAPSTPTPTPPAAEPSVAAAPSDPEPETVVVPAGEAKA
ncbi:MAG: twin-arginine translocase subunit TatB [Bauldia sp.]|nr:twin-arginine translocase subunit TatB [Bauldia sp.]